MLFLVELRCYYSQLLIFQLIHFLAVISNMSTECTFYHSRGAPPETPTMRVCINYASSLFEMPFLMFNQPYEKKLGR